ncbi:Ig-like domain-containing protein [Clostridium sp. 19966]|uniref:Ig-like domain-containing protein n=1 Tax=Clostridium sp. 19966 TaxID=2768166 RepID=UPI0028E08674|nr:Ig-like domain-containing protein [Clostridium sp. 19966]MDT8715923.1 Ig-like domain-containing protein [Clostridium sp. 19966]
MNKITDLMKGDKISLPKAIKEYEFKHPTVNLQYIEPGNILSINREVFHAFKLQWTPIYNTEVLVPDSVTVSSAKDLEAVKAIATYSDASILEKSVKWDCSEVDFYKQGTYKLKGKVVQAAYSFPLARGYADPVILPWNDKYYSMNVVVK